MENASKALLMAAGILLVMLIVSLVIFAWGRFSDFYNNEDQLQDVEDIAKFNLQFTGYQNRDVHGYELISLANKVADYNFRRSNLQEAKNDQKYNPIKMTINLNGNAEKFMFSKEIDNNGNKITSSNGHSYFSNYNTILMEQSDVKNQILQIINDATKISNEYGDERVAAQLAKSINSLILSKYQIEYNWHTKHMTEQQSKQIALDYYKSMVPADKKKDTYEEMVTQLLSDGDIMKYYEYLQFKKGEFQCTGIKYDDNVSNRVSEINFNFTGEIE